MRKVIDISYNDIYKKNNIIFNLNFSGTNINKTNNNKMISFISDDFRMIKEGYCTIEDCTFEINDNELLNYILDFIKQNLNLLYKISKSQINLELPIGGSERIFIKYKNLIFDFDCSIINNIFYKNKIKKFINEIFNIAKKNKLQQKKNKDDKLKSYMEEFINQPLSEPTELDKEFDKYCSLYKEKFGKNAYIAEPNGTKEKTIEAIKTCLEKNEDLLDNLLYPNYEDDMNNGNLY